MAKGADSKAIVVKKILETFPDSFLYNNDKEIRIPMKENGETIEIKVVLSCAKTPVAGAASAAALDWSNPSATEIGYAATTSQQTATEISEEDRRKVQELMTKLGL